MNLVVNGLKKCYGDKWERRIRGTENWMNNQVIKRETRRKRMVELIGFLVIYIVLGAKRSFRSI